MNSDTGDPACPETGLSIPDDWLTIVLFGQINAAWLHTFPELPHGIPLHDTLGRVCARLDAAGFEGEGLSGLGAGHRPSTGHTFCHQAGLALHGHYRWQQLKLKQAQPKY